MPLTISFADLTHTGQAISANTFPLGISFVAGYAKQELGDAIEIDIFRYPKEFSEYLGKTAPDIACFTSFSWNTSLSHEYARRIKAKNEKTIIIFGGVNFPTARDEQEAFLKRYPAIDFYVDGEGELAFVNLLNVLKEWNYDAKALKESGNALPNVHYIKSDRLVAGPLMPRIEDLSIIPSPYAMGLLDKFFDGVLTPVMQITRGCPYSCTFCHDGDIYYNKTRRFSMERAKWELEYIANKVDVNDLMITDLNFGMFKEDVEIARFLGELQDKHDYPRYVCLASAKNNKERIIEISRLLRGALHPGASVQSTDPGVLSAIKRKNLPVVDLVEVASTRINDNASSLSEVILCLPGDSKEAHIKSNVEMINAGMTLFRNHQFMLLMGTEAASKESRAKYQLQTRFRVQPRCFGFYELYGERFSAVEIEEICVAGKNITYDEYQDCRAFDLTIEIFLNDALFFDLLQFISQQKIRLSGLVLSIYEKIMTGKSGLSETYKAYRAEEKANVWEDSKAFEEYLRKPEVIEKYISNELGNNEIYKYRAMCVFENIDAINEMIFDTAHEMLNLEHDPRLDLYIDDLKRYSMFSKKRFIDTEQTYRDRFNFDFVKLADCRFSIDPLSVYVEEGLEIEFLHTDRQKDIVHTWLHQYGTDINSLGRMLSRSQVSAMYRSARYV
jgi:tRNA A37 methylthiotransferase MiaB